MNCDRRQMLEKNYTEIGRGTGEDQSQDGQPRDKKSSKENESSIDQGGQNDGMVGSKDLTSNSSTLGGDSQDLKGQKEKGIGGDAIEVKPAQVKIKMEGKMEIILHIKKSTLETLKKCQKSQIIGKKSRKIQ